MKIQIALALLSPWLAVPASDPVLEVEEALDALHRAAAAADGERYFGAFAPEAVFLGTDAGERWSLAEFRAYAEPYFSKGQGWTYLASERHVGLARAGDVAWFDERLQNEKYGEARGSGALERRDGAWKVVQYNLTFPVPNEEAPELTKKVMQAETAGQPRGRQLFARDGERQLALWNRVVPERLDLEPDDRPVVVLLPSASITARALWDLPRKDCSVQRALARRGFDTFAVELGGYGLSSQPAEAGGGCASAVRDLSIAVEYIRELRGVERVVLVGPSWGAQVAGAFAAAHPERVRGVVLYGFTWTRLAPGEALAAASGADVLESDTREVSQASVLGDFRHAAAEEGVPEAFAAFAASQGRSVPTGALRDLVRELPLVDPGKLDVPVLMMAGRMEVEWRDEESGELVVNGERLEDNRGFYAALPGPRHWIEIPEGGHLVHLERPRRLFQRCLAGWIERLPE